MTARDPDAERGYREQMAELQRDDTTGPRAQFILDQQRAISPDTSWHGDRIEATTDYLKSMEPEWDREAGS